MGNEEDRYALFRELASKGGEARAKNLTAEQRSESAREAAKARWSLPQATHRGELPIGGTVFECAVLKDGTRVLSQDSFMQGMGLYWSGWQAEQRRKQPDESSAGMPLFMTSISLKRFIDKDLEALLSEPLKYRSLSGQVAHGIRATVIPRICKVWLEARDGGALRGKRQKAVAAKADILMRALAEVGIIALVDEATGYQESRSRQALQEILDKFIAKEFSRWAKRFPDDFYEELFRLRGWDYTGMQVARPSVVGKWTNDLVYDRLAPAIRRELETRNPKNERGNRPRKHHQHLTPDIGHPKLDAHLYAVTGLMRAAASWEQFIRMIDRAYPRFPDTPLFPELEERSN